MLGTARRADPLPAAGGRHDSAAADAYHAGPGSAVVDSTVPWPPTPARKHVGAADDLLLG